MWGSQFRVSIPNRIFLCALGQSAVRLIYMTVRRYIIAGKVRKCRDAGEILSYILFLEH